MREQTAAIYKETRVEDRMRFVKMVRTVIEKIKNINRQSKLSR